MMERSGPEGGGMGAPQSGGMGGPQGGPKNASGSDQSYVLELLKVDEEESSEQLSSLVENDEQYAINDFLKLLA